MKVALVHDWLTGMRGGEKCLEIFCEMFPKAHLYTLLHASGSVSPTIERMDIRTSLLQKIPGISHHYRYYLPLFPWIVDHWDTGGEEYDLVLSSSHCVAKGIRFPSAKRRVCYCFTPMRYLWCQTENYYAGEWKQLALSIIRGPLKQWDLASNSQVDEFIGISNHVCERIHHFYGRSSITLYPPVDTDFYHPQPSASPHPKDDFYLMAGALEPYKRADLAIEAFRQWNRPLKIVGKGTLLESLRKKAPPNVEFLGWQSDEKIRQLYQTARALIFPGEEDFGIVPIEAQACGCPVVAYGHGGVIETVVADQTGLFFDHPTPESLLDALHRFEKRSWHSPFLRSQAEKFTKRRFQQELQLHLGGSFQPMHPSA